ncbi:hypothetical protein KQI08_06040 [Paraeggerthella hongkongensis]|uniref:hypothetical protein n=1 Tax=Paraeggerthella hominis TaxID=2897351 RepID=UPI001C11FBBD|nr:MULTISPECIES: hypothetical protein [Paraeggerthella]MBU5405482.1 hypothetical protein [Paraeggerthella hongkongensis]MCD2434204.1 hypothetical protein [Paraeggerthella hominis]
MGEGLVADDRSLLGRAFSLASRKSQTLESIAKALDVSPEDLSLCWIVLNKLRRCQGRALPAPFAVEQSAASTEAPMTQNWYAPTWLLSSLLETYQVNEGLAVHYARILSDPEGGHYELNLAAEEVAAAARLEYGASDTLRLKRVCVQACEPENGVELLVSNAGNILLNIEAYRGEPLSASFIESLHAKLVEGISIKEVCGVEFLEADVSERRALALESFCATCEGNHTLINALVSLYYFKTFRLFPAGNSVLAYILYFIVLHRAGYHFSAHIPVLKLLYSDDENFVEDHCLSGTPEDLAVACDGYYDWTGYFERAVALVVDEQRWTMTKLEGMRRRRERLRLIIDADESLNYRQKAVLLEAVLHSNAEFTYAIHVHRYGISYPCARSDFARLLDLGFLRQHDDGIRHFFVASEKFHLTFLPYLQEHCSEMFLRYYREDGSLIDEFKSIEDASLEYNRDVGFYEKSLLDKTYIEHYDHRRAQIAESDGPQRRGQSKG